jgi:hypothetical protein
MIVHRDSERGARTVDLLHVAVAHDLLPDYLYSFDWRQRKRSEAVRPKVN